MTKKRFVADVVLCAVPILKVGTYRVQHSKSHPRLFFTSKNSLRSQSSKKTVTKTIENIRQDEENLYYAPNRSSGDGDDVMQGMAHHQYHFHLHASRRFIQSDDYYLD